MIRPLGEDDRAEAVTFLLQAPAYNLYLLGNLETLGFDHNFCQFWGDFANGGRELRAVLNRYMNGWTLYGLHDADWAGLAQVVDAHGVTAARLQDNPGGVASFLPYLRDYSAERIQIETLMQLTAKNFQAVAPPMRVKVRRATLADLPALIEFYADAGQMTRAPAAVERPLRDTRVWLAESPEGVVSAALTNAETAELAMIGGVFTSPAWRGRGLSPAVCSALCAELLAIPKQPVLYWDTPAAGIVYQKLGFQAVGQWRSVWLKRAAGR